jgi:GNAT superfamily N-acetyltransferase
VAIRLRSGTVADVSTYARLINAQHQWLRHEDLWDVDELASLLVSPTSDPVRFDRYLEADGVAVAGLHTHVSEPFSRTSLYLASPPGDDRTAHAKQLLDAGERLLRGRPEIPRHATVQIEIPQEDVELSRLLITEGYVHTDDVVILESELAQSPEPRWPEGVTAKALDVATDLDRAFEVMKVSFMPEPGGWHISRDDFTYMMRKDPTALRGLSLMALRDRHVVGICVNFADTTRAVTGLIGMLGVAPEHRRSGVGSALLAESLRTFRDQGWTHARVATIVGHSAVDLSFFQSAGMAPIYINQMYVKRLY